MIIVIIVISVILLFLLLRNKSDLKFCDVCGIQITGDVDSKICSKCNKYFGITSSDSRENIINKISTNLIMLNQYQNNDCIIAKYELENTIKEFNKSGKQKMHKEGNDFKKRKNSEIKELRLERVEMLLELAEHIEIHSSALSAKKMRLHRSDNYGFKDSTEWNEEIISFTNKVMNDMLERLEEINKQIIYKQQALGQSLDRFYFVIWFEAQLYKYSMMISDFSSISSGYEFEEYCAQLISSIGYDVKICGTSGDQGVDIIAEDENQRLGYQCKFYNKPVGNSAVQEVVAGKKLYGLDKVYVIGISGFTKSAKELAAINDVGLITPYDIQLKNSEELGVPREIDISYFSFDKIDIGIKINDKIGENIALHMMLFNDIEKSEINKQKEKKRN